MNVEENLARRAIYAADTTIISTLLSFLLVYYFPDQMKNIAEIKTERLLLRQWQEEDKPAFARLNADPMVMEFYPDVLSEEESNAMADRIMGLIAKRGWGLWAVELLNEDNFIGFVGLHEPTHDLPCSPCVEIGWRLVKEYWGYGYATEAAKAALEFAFNAIMLSEVYSFTSTTNIKSEAVMKRINMKNIHNNFEHPIFPIGNPLREHVLYRIDKKLHEASSPNIA